MTAYLTNPTNSEIGEVESVYVKTFIKPMEDHKEYHIYICSDIGSPEHYVEMFQQLKSAEENDVVNMYINSPGGYITTCVQIVHHMRSCKAAVTTVLESEAHSCGSIIFLAGDNFSVGKHAMMLIHNQTMGYFGKGHELKSYIKASDSRFVELAKDIYYPFLTEDEIDRVAKDDDMWLSEEEIIGRLEILQEFRDIQRAHDKKEMLLAQIEAVKVMAEDYHMELDELALQFTDILQDERVSSILSPKKVKVKKTQASKKPRSTKK